MRPLIPQPASSPSASAVFDGSASRGDGSAGPASQPAWNSLYASGPRACVRSVAVANASSARSCSPIAFASLWYQLPIAHSGIADGTFVSNVLTKVGVSGPTMSRACASSHCKYAWKCGPGNVSLSRYAPWSSSSCTAITRSATGRNSASARCSQRAA
ncbi:MAG TPA: hypothetical protein VGU66_19715 [Candidatus Elarobacter sp.]|nr:hypothetical protein [Candidatus Elarobacter sp.]